MVQAGHVGSRLRPNHTIGAAGGSLEGPKEERRSGPDWVCLHGERRLCSDCPVMGQHRKTDVSQGNTMEQYTTAVPTQQRVTRAAGSDDGQSGLLPVEEPSQAEILAAIQGSRVVLQGKIEAVAVEHVTWTPDYTNKVQNSRKRFLEVKAKLRSMNIRYMVLYPAHLKVLSGGRSHFFEKPEEVWRWLEMWDKAALGRPTGARRVVNRTSGADGSDWWNRDGERTTDSMDQRVVDVPAPRVEIQQDGTMAVVPDESVAGTGAGPDLDSSATSMQS
ncbi:hypothetical protein NDU88_004430 [Pleurodeles waltl]|uniref:Uncharacterized protein n=1 Tax=Pleurodeles waltl TaxID=8319 RepID=A0AAV7LQY3_PLEWA|nr:hypothetical protein NDU88_004430 [Pleurodeles waltl]